MPELSNEDLLLLDNLIYVNGLLGKNGRSVSTIVNSVINNNNDECMMSNDEWKNILNNIKSRPELMNLTLYNSKEDSKGTRAACFVDPDGNATVVYRGTNGDYEWYDDGKGFYQSDTKQQEAAARYVDSLPFKNITVTGHSKGGNKAQYVTIACNTEENPNKIGRCVSFDGQGFSDKFIKNHSDSINANKDKITSICAANDPVHSLMIPIAGKYIFLGTKSESNLFMYHKPNEIFQNNGLGGLNKETSEGNFPKYVNQFTEYLMKNMKDPEKGFTVDGIINLALIALDGGNTNINWEKVIGGGLNSATFLNSFILDKIKDNYGVGAEWLTGRAELLAISSTAILCPFLAASLTALSARGIIKSDIDMMNEIAKQMLNLGNEILNEIRNLGEQFINFANDFEKALDSFISNIEKMYNQTLGSFNISSSNEPIYINPDHFRILASRLSSVQNRLRNVNMELNQLRQQEDWYDIIDKFITAGIEIEAFDENWDLLKCIDYLNTAADEFDSCERKLNNIAMSF